VIRNKQIGYYPLCSEDKTSRFQWSTPKAWMSKIAHGKIPYGKWELDLFFSHCDWN